jgi:hypothetical protein
MTLHVRFAKRQNADLRVDGLPLQKVTAQERQFLERDLVFAKHTQIDADREWCAPAIRVNTVEQKLPDIAFVVKTGQDIFHRNLFSDPGESCALVTRGIPADHHLGLRPPLRTMTIITRPAKINSKIMLAMTGIS